MGDLSTSEGSSWLIEQLAGLIARTGAEQAGATP